VQVARLELHKVDLASLSHSVEMPGAEDCALAKVRPEVVDENASFNVCW